MPSMKPTNLSAAAQNAEQRVRLAVELVKTAEKKARAAKEKAWRAKLRFKLAKRASKKAKKAAKRARARAVQAQIALKELTEQIVPATRPSVGTRASASTPRRNAMTQSSTGTQRKQPTGATKAGVEPPRASARPRPAQTRSAAKPTTSEATARSAKRKPPAREAADHGIEAFSGRPGESKEATSLGAFGEDGIRPAQASLESPAENTGARNEFPTDSLSEY